MSEKEKGQSSILTGYNCAQAVVGAFAEELGLDFDMAVQLVSGFGGGMPLAPGCVERPLDGICSERKLGYSDPKANVEKKELYQEIQRIVEQFGQRERGHCKRGAISRSERRG